MISSLRVQKREYLWNEEGCSRGENAVLLYFGEPFGSAAIIFCFIGTLKITPFCKVSSSLNGK